MKALIEYYKTQNLIEKMVTTGIVPGVNYALLRKNQVFTSTVGFSTYLPENKQLSPFAQYDLASLTKVLGTTNVFLKLYQEEKLNFTEPIKEFLPEFSDERVRISHLLTHTSGIRGYIKNRDQLSATELRTALLSLPVTEDFENRVKYADTNFILLGFILEKIYQKPVQQVIIDEIITPTKLKRIGFTPEIAMTVPTTLQADGTLLQGVVHDPKAQILGESCGSAGMFSNLNDLIELARNYLGVKNDVLPLKNETLAMLYEDKIPRKLHPRSYGWDLRFDPTDHHALLYHTGFTGTFMILDRKLQTGMIVLTNRIHPSGQNQLFLTMRDRIIAKFLEENK